jgi:hypothetical protein
MLFVRDIAREAVFATISLPVLGRIKRSAIGFDAGTEAEVKVSGMAQAPSIHFYDSGKVKPQHKNMV